MEDNVKDLLGPIDSRIERLTRMRQDLIEEFGSGGGAAPAREVDVPLVKKRTMSPEAKKRISAAAKKRWADLRKGVKKATKKKV